MPEIASYGQETLIILVALVWSPPFIAHGPGDLPGLMWDDLGHCLRGVVCKEQKQHGKLIDIFGGML